VVNKNTLAVRFGIKMARYEIATLALGPFFLGIYWWHLGSHYVAALSLLCLPLAFVVVKNVFQNAPSPVYNRFLGQSAGLHLAFGLLAALGLWLS
jgi:1,4-dihydroxy-2-naphthoate octaprenyltransferase